MTTNQHIIEAARDDLIKAYETHWYSKHGYYPASYDSPSFYKFSVDYSLEQISIKAKELAETQAQLKEAREALREMQDLHNLAPEDVPLHEYQTIESYALELTSRMLKEPESYSALDAAIEPYRLDAERWREFNKDGLTYFYETLVNAKTQKPTGEVRYTIYWTGYCKPIFQDAIDSAIARKG